jgi:hypothetical protein
VSSDVPSDENRTYVARWRTHVLFKICYRTVGGGPPALGRGLSLVSFTIVHSGSWATAGSCPRWSGTLADGGERWCAVLESV